MFKVIGPASAAFGFVTTAVTGAVAAVQERVTGPVPGKGKLIAHRPRNAKGEDLIPKSSSLGTLEKLPAELLAQVFSDVAIHQSIDGLLPLEKVSKSIQGAVSGQIEELQYAASVKTPEQIRDYPARLAKLPLRERIAPLYNFAFHEMDGELDKTNEATIAFAEALRDIDVLRRQEIEVPGKENAGLRGHMPGYARLRALLDAPRSEQRLMLWQGATPRERTAYIRSIVVHQAELKGEKLDAASLETRMWQSRGTVEQLLAIHLAIQARRQTPGYDAGKFQADFGFENRLVADRWLRKAQPFAMPDWVQPTLVETNRLDKAWAEAFAPTKLALLPPPLVEAVTTSGTGIRKADAALPAGSRSAAICWREQDFGGSEIPTRSR